MATATVPIINPVVNRKFAVRRLIKIVAVVCECGAITHGRGVTKWKTCPRCGCFIIKANEQRQREGWYKSIYLDDAIYERVSKSL